MRICFVGINGVSMRALADLAAAAGHTVTGSDAAAGGHDPKNVEGADLVVYTGAVPEDNCELVRARERGIPTVERAVYLGEISRSFRTVAAVAGCHGKSTAAAMLGRALYPRSPTVHVGAAGASVIGKRDIFVTEACEYRRSFLALSPDLGVILNIGFDHPDCYSDSAEIYAAYSAFRYRCSHTLAHESCGELGDRTFGTNGNYRAEDVAAERGRRSFTFVARGKRAARVKLSVPGEHNVLNALAALSAADMLGEDVSLAADAVGAFTGLPRRFEYKGDAYGMAVYSDYAHHPDELRATIISAREIFPSVTAVFQPHTYTRTAALADGFAEALSLADKVILAPVFPARESAIPGVSSDMIAEKLSAIGRTARSCCSLKEAADACKKAGTAAALFLGAGDIDGAADAFVAEGKN